MNLYKQILIFISLFIANSLFGSNSSAPKVQNFKTNQACFVENKGQLATSDIKYYSHEGGVYVYCQPGKISFVLNKVSKESRQISESTSRSVSEVGVQDLEHLLWKQQAKKFMSTSRATLILLNSNSSAQIIASDQQEYYESYYTTGNADHGITNVHTYKTIIYKSIYNHIDLILHSREEGLKYAFVVYPGGKVSDIKLQWKGLENIEKLSQSDPFGKDSPSSRAGGIEYSFALGKMEESAPYTYQGIASVGAGLAPAQSANASLEIESHFVLINNTISFKTGKYDKTKTLVIDPTLDWGTYFGGEGWDRGTSLSTDKDGNVFMAGLTYSASGITTPGAYQTNENAWAGNAPYGGAPNAFLSKFTSNGDLLWSTYYGGDSSTCAYGVSTDGQGNVYITGETLSVSGIATNNSYQTQYGGESYYEGDAFLAKFSGSGSLEWATYYGGKSGESGYGVVADTKGDVYITGSTFSTSGIASHGAYQTIYGGGRSDGFLAKFNRNGYRLWSTYFGGSGTDVGSELVSDSLGNIYLTGQTSSFKDITTNGVYKTSMTKNDASDAFIAKFDSLGKLKWATYYGGNSIDVGIGIAADNSGNIYISGMTESDSGISTTGAWQTSIISADGVSDFVSKFNNTGSLIWSTYYGGGQCEGDNSNGIATDRFGNVYLIGETCGFTNISTNGAWQTSYAGNGDAYLADFNINGMLKWATYYGGPSDEWGYAIAADNEGTVYITGHTDSKTGIATQGSYKDSFLNSVEDDGGDAFLAKFSFMQSDNDAGISYFLSLDNTICPDMQPVMVLLKNYGKTPLQSATIDWEINGKVQKPYSWTGNMATDSVMEINLGTGLLSLGNYNIKAWTTNPNGMKDSVPGNDTSFTVYNISPPDAHWNVSALGSLSKTFTAIDGQYQLSDYEWNFGDGTTATGNPVTHVYLAEGKFKVQLTICSGQYDSSIWVINTLNESIFPNPFSLQTNIQYKLPYPTHIKITVYDMLGRQVTSLCDNNLGTGEYTTVFDAGALRTRPGVYTVVFMDDNNVIKKEIVQIESIFH